MGECPRCRPQPRDDLFLHHVARVAKLVKHRYSATPLIWDDMLRHVQASAMQEYNLGDLVEPMVWVYAENVYRFVLPAVRNIHGQRNGPTCDQS
jgi:hexosaminidase